MSRPDHTPTERVHNSKWFKSLHKLEQNEIKLANYYAENLASGSCNHNMILLVDKLSRMLQQSVENNLSLLREFKPEYLKEEHEGSNL